MVIFLLLKQVYYINWIYMNNSYKELLKQREALEQAIASAREKELSEAVRKARELVAEFGLTVQDIFPAGRGATKSAGKSTGNKVAPKYRDPATGQTWTGRGKAPKWIDGQDRNKYLIA
jgi:DNA-binding protein H-NS